jgi:hypothetical protein
MKRKELLELVSEKCGLKATKHHLIYAQKLGLVDSAPIVAGWKEYSSKHVKQLTNYLNQYSRTRLQRS